MIWEIKDLYKDEIRCNFLVTADRKKIWQADMYLLREVDRICRKYGITYFADYGTLLGAVRHKGFIPWDDDIDIVMLRPDYEKFKLVVQNELDEPYFFQNMYTDNCISAFARIRNSKTAAIGRYDNIDINQGIFVDIFPLDDVPDGTKRQEHIFQIQMEIWRTLVDEKELLLDVERGLQTRLSIDLLKRLLKLPKRECFAEFEKFCINHFGASKQVDLITDSFIGKQFHVLSDYYSDVVYLPFEGIELPAPAMYHEILTCRYGDYNKLVKGASQHEGALFSADISYKELLECHKVFQAAVDDLQQ